MVDQVGGKPLSIRDRNVARVERTGPARPVETPRTETATPSPAAASAGFGRIARDLAASPPVDVDRVARIRRAIAEGRFPVTPASIADNLLALKLDWLRNDEA